MSSLCASPIVLVTPHPHPPPTWSLLSCCHSDPKPPPPLTPCLGQRQLTASPMTAWIVLPVSLAAFSITGIWIVWVMAQASVSPVTFQRWLQSGVRMFWLHCSSHLTDSICCTCRYAMAVMNHHVCPVENWYVLSFLVGSTTRVSASLMTLGFLIAGFQSSRQRLNWAHCVWCCRSYNVTCTEELPRPGFPKTCCTIQDIPLIRCAVVPLLLDTVRLLVTENKTHFVSAKRLGHELASCHVAALCQSLTHALHNLNLCNLRRRPWTEG